MNGDWDAAIEAYEEAWEIALRHRTGLETEATNRAGLAAAYVGAGQIERGRESAEHAIEVAERIGARHDLIAAKRALARVLLASESVGAKAAIEAALDHAEALAEEMGARPYLPMILEDRAELARACGDEAAHEQHLREAHRLFGEIGATGHVRRLAEELDL